MNPKILVFSPTYEGKDYIFKQFYHCITHLDYDNYDFMIIDNSKDMSYVTKLRREGYRHIHHVPRGGNSRQALSNAQNYARQRAIKDGYDFILSVESDLLPPPDVLKRFLTYNLPIVGGLYYLQAGSPINGEKVRIPCVFFLQLKGLMRGTRLISLQEAQYFPGHGLQKVHGCGLGCTLIRRDIFEKFMFWHDERFTDKHSDVYFYMELENAGIPVYCDTNYIVDHYPSEWDKVKDR